MFAVFVQKDGNLFKNKLDNKMLLLKRAYDGGKDVKDSDGKRQRG